MELITTYIRLQKCGLDEFWTCFCTAWPVWKQLVDDIRGREEVFFDFVCGCQTRGGVAEADAIAASQVFRDADFARRLIVLMKCGNLDQICCLKPHFKRLDSLIDNNSVEELNTFQVLLCGCGPTTAPATTATPAAPAVTTAEPTPVASAATTAECGFAFPENPDRFFGGG